MKKTIFILSIFTLFMMGCSDETVENIDNQNLELNRESAASDLMKEVINSPEFNEMFNSSSSLARNNGDNGIMVIENGFTIIFGIQEGTNVYFLGANASDDYIAFMPNGTARFYVHSSRPTAFVLDLSTFSTSYSNTCLEGRTGQFNASVRGTYEVSEFPFGTVYFIDELSSADVMVGHSRVSDAQAIYDEDFNFTGCTDATDYKTLRLRWITGNGQNQDSNISVSLD